MVTHHAALVVVVETQHAALTQLMEHLLNDVLGVVGSATREPGISLL